MSEFDLEPHEQLDEIDRRTNDDGTVQVELLEWEKNYSGVTVSFRTPTGEVMEEKMRWPEAKDNSFKFIRFINETPYTLRTAEGINDDGSLMLPANPSNWQLHLPEKKSVAERVPLEKEALPIEVLKFVFYPAALVVMVFNLIEKDAEHVGRRGQEYEHTYLEDEKHHTKHITALKSALYLTLWAVMFALIFL